MMEIRELEIEKIKPWKDNPRLNEQAIGAVARSIESFGFNVPILCDGNLMIIAGHTRWKAAQQIGLKTVPVIMLDLSDSQRRAFSIADNKTSEISDWDFPKLRDVLKELQGEDVDFASMGFGEQDLRRLLIDEAEEENDLPEVADKPKTKEGEMIVLGNHRVLCGDSRDRNKVEILIDEGKVDHVFGGPPYFNQREYAHWDEYDLYLADMQKIIENCHDIMKAGNIVVWNIGNGCSTHHDHTSHHSRLFEKSGLVYLDTIVWVKSGANYTIPRNAHIQRTRCYYPAFQWEALLVFQKEGRMPKMSVEGAEYMSHCQTNVWEIPAVIHQKALYGHPAVCPVEIPYRCLQAYTRDGATVFDPFGGSGTTLIAAEKSSRKARLMERNPLYCDMIVKRWETLTGDQASRMSI